MYFYYVLIEIVVLILISHIFSLLSKVEIGALLEARQDRTLTSLSPFCGCLSASSPFLRDESSPRVFEPDRVVSLTPARLAKRHFVQRRDDVNIWTSCRASFLLDLKRLRRKPRIPLSPHRQHWNWNRIRTNDAFRCSFRTPSGADGSLIIQALRYRDLDCVCVYVCIIWSRLTRSSCWASCSVWT